MSLCLSVPLRQVKGPSALEDQPRSSSEVKNSQVQTAPASGVIASHVLYSLAVVWTAKLDETSGFLKDICFAPVSVDLPLSASDKKKGPRT